MSAKKWTIIGVVVGVIGILVTVYIGKMWNRTQLEENPEPVVYRITYDANGGTFTDGNVIYQETFIGNTSPINILMNGGIPIRNGYKFSHWSNNIAGGGEVWLNGKHTHLSGDHTLYAVWVLENSEP